MTTRRPFEKALDPLENDQWGTAPSRFFVAAGHVPRCAVAAFAVTVALYPSWAADIDSVSWGQTTNDVRLGLGVESKSDQLRLAFQNVGRSELGVLLGGRTGIGPVYWNLKFAAIDSKGAEFHVEYFGGANFVGGYMEPLLVRLAPGEIYELALPLDKFTCFLNGNIRKAGIVPSSRMVPSCALAQKLIVFLWMSNPI
jgi:hypothetical protein